MAGFSEILEQYLQAIQFMSGAELVSMFVPDPHGDDSRALLVHSGASPLLPELATTSAAVEFAHNFNPNGVNRLNPNDVLGPTLQSQAPGSVLLPLYPTRDDSQGEAPTAWIGLRGVSVEQLPDPFLDHGSTHWWTWLRKFGQAITRDSLRALGVLNDPVTGLPGRATLFAQLKEEIEGGEDDTSTSIVFTSPDNFSTINELRGLQAGDAVIREIGERLKPLMRPDDVLVRYGGVVFGILLPHTSAEEASKLTTAIHSALSTTNYLNDNVHLFFSCGVSVTSSPPEGRPEHALTVIQHANQALNAAKRAGGNQITKWQTSISGEGSDLSSDELTGIFTGTMGKDYRNMVLLWDTVGFIAETGDPHQFASKALEAIYNAFRPGRIGFYLNQQRDRGRNDAEGDQAPTLNLTLIEGYVPITQAGITEMTHTQSQSAFELSHSERHLLERSCLDGVLLGSNVPTVQSANLPIDHSAIAVPLLTKENCVGCFYLARHDDRINLDPSDVHFLKVFANQIAIALDRSILAEQEKKALEQKRLKLLGEVHELRQALSHAKLIHSSSAMEEVLSIVRQVAPTDATVLITGESGTGKGVLADTIHKSSTRKNQTLIMVDCSAISSTLIESELFGHERGAFTGAEKKAPGRLAEADGGTVFLDEIGELPLEIQSKLLTFVQDKAIVPVGSSKSRKVDVRIVAATNRDLAAEVDAGKFRRDLYYRLNVVTIHIPPLRDRPDDILMLARHFLERSNVQYQKSVHGFTNEAEAALRLHPWPGNVRELQNRIMRAVILCNLEMLGPVELGFAQVQQSAIPAASTVTTVASSLPSMTTPQSTAPIRKPWNELDEILKRIIQRVDGHRTKQPPPFGKWLEDDLVQVAYAQVGGIHRRGAALLGIPETTFRRRMKQLQARSQIGPTPRTPEWVEVVEVLEKITEDTNSSQQDWVLRSRDVLLHHVLDRFGNRVPFAASLMGVTEPTIHRWRSRLAQA